MVIQLLTWGGESGVIFDICDTLCGGEGDKGAPVQFVHNNVVHAKNARDKRVKTTATVKS